MKHNSIILFSIVFLFACKNKIRSADADANSLVKQKVISAEKTHSDTIYIDIKGNKYAFLGEIPDSLRTSEQSKLIYAIADVTTSYMSVKSNHMVFDLTKEQFVAKGIPGRYYDQIQKNIVDNNNYIDANGIKNVDQLMKDRRNDYLKSKAKK